VAIAAHGKRCQQSPFRGSPYCWHHTQSRKIWAPSRPLGSGTSSKASAPAVPDEVATPEHRSGERRAAWAALETQAVRLAEALGPERVDELLEFLESPADGAYLLVRDESGLLTERSISERPRRRSA
jgi:hypothetical protein